MKTKLFIAAFALALTCTVSSCGNKKAETAPAADSVKVDSVKTVATDSVKTDSVKSTSVDKAAKPAEKK